MIKRCRNCGMENYKLKKCFECGVEYCEKCGIGRQCKSCYLLTQDKALVSEYFAEKYAKKTAAGIIIMLLLMMVPFVYSQAASLISKDCVVENADYTIKEPQYTAGVVNWPNGTKETTQTFTGYKDVLVKNNKTTCKEKIIINDEDVDFKLQGYNCKEISGEIICDSTIDGNGDGVCSPGGGETCCKVKDNEVTCKNSAVSWNDKSSPLPVLKLGAQ